MMEIIDVAQGSEEWLLARLGIPTASNFATVMAKGRSGGDSATRRKYMMRLAGERITGQPEETYKNAHMERGNTMEAEARTYYCFITDTLVERVGFIRNGEKGCSPDSLIGANGMLEVKTHLPSILIDMILKDEFPPEHKAQVQGQLWVAEREWSDIICYWPGMPSFVKRAYRDSAYIRDLSRAVDQFNEELHEVVAKIQAYGEPQGLAA